MKLFLSFGRCLVLLEVRHLLLNRFQLRLSLLPDQVQHFLLSIIGQPVEDALQSALAFVLYKSKCFLPRYFYEFGIVIPVLSDDLHFIVIQPESNHKILIVDIAYADQFYIVGDAGSVSGPAFRLNFGGRTSFCGADGGTEDEGVVGYIFYYLFLFLPFLLQPMGGVV
jgi:hypothetical protein